MITAYLTFNGNTEEAFNFYQSVLGGEFTNIQQYGNSPQASQLSKDDHEKIMHITLSGPDGAILMGNNYMDFMGKSFNPGNNFSLSLHPKSEEKARKLFEDLSENGSISVPFERAPWGAYFGMFTDKFGIKWMINYQQDA